MNPSKANEAPSLWQEGWYQFAAHQVSPNFGPRPRDARVDLLVLHSISLPPGDFGGDHVQQLFTNRLDWNAHPYFKSIEGMKVSAHFFIRRNGDLCQFVSCFDRAWHAGTSHYRGRSDCNDDSIGIELEGLEGSLFESEQYDTLTSLSAALLARFPIVYIAGHEHIAPGRKFDPGDGFDWPYLQRALGLKSKSLPPAAIPT